MGIWLDRIEEWLRSSKQEGFRGEHAVNLNTKYEYVPPPKEEAAGGVVLAGLHGSLVDHVYVCKSSWNFSGWTFPKGRVDLGETREIAALREVEEESGLKARFLPKPYLGMFLGSFTFNHFYMMVRTGGNPKMHDKEMAEVRLVSFDEARKLFKKSHNHRDLKVLELAEDYVKSLKARGIGGVN